MCTPDYRSHMGSVSKLDDEMSLYAAAIRLAFTETKRLKHCSSMTMPLCTKLPELHDD